MGACLSSCDKEKEMFEVFDYVRYCWSDMHGIPRGKSLPVQEASNNLERGIRVFAGTHIEGPNGQNPDRIPLQVTNVTGNGLAIPQPGTVFPVNWAGDGRHKVGAVLCETYWDIDTPQEACPRYLARKQLSKLKENYGYDVFSGFELEFLLVHKGTKDPVSSSGLCLSFYNLSSVESFLYDIEKCVRSAGLEVSAIHTENAPGNYEISLKPSFGVRSADMYFILKDAIKEMSLARNMEATCIMVLPSGSGGTMHFNHSIWNKKGRNILHDPDNDDTLSEFAHNWIGGLCKHAKALSALCKPTVNCYRHTSSVFPKHANWSRKSRLALYRVNTFSPSDTYIENRMGTAGNPYIIMAATLAAGMLGVENKEPCPPDLTKIFTSERTNSEHRPSEHNMQNSLPGKLEEALKELEEDKELCEALGPEFIQSFICCKRGVELSVLKSDDPLNHKADDLQKELNLYFDAL